MTGAFAEADVVLRGVTKTFGPVIAVDNLTLEIPRGIFLSLLGPSGCGKTTTLRLIAGFEQPSQGDIFIRGQRVNLVPAYRRDFSMVFQNFALFPHMTVANNVAFGLRMRRLPRDEREGSPGGIRGSVPSATVRGPAATRGPGAGHRRPPCRPAPG